MRAMTNPSTFGAGLLSAMLVVALAGCAAPAGQDAEMVSTVGGRSAAAAPARPAPPDPMALGNADAPLMIVEFSDYQCPYCRRFHAEVLPELRRNYIDTGKVRLVFKDLPLPMHREALPAAVAARCAAAQGKYWEMNEALFANQADLSADLYPRIAKALGLDLKGFEACRADPATAQTVMGDARGAQQFGLSSTPSFLIGRREGERLRVESVGRGFAAYPVFAHELDKLLAATAKDGGS
jgi:protein-disulfide isomerase